MNSYKAAQLMEVQNRLIKIMIFLKK